MLRILFWNLRKNASLIQPLAAMVRERLVDVVVTVENPLAPDEMRESLSTASGVRFSVHAGRNNTRALVFSCGPAEVGQTVAESPYLAIYPISSHGVSILLAVFHGISLLENKPVDLNEEACVAAQLLRDTETERQHRRTVLVGDFNLNPFDDGMAKARGFFGVMSRAVAAREQQRLKFNDYPLFYSPMWSRLGDLSPGPPGTFFRRRTSHLEYYWHTYDQVLIRPVLLDAFDPANFEVLERVGSVELLEDGVPNGEVLSDHLPVFIGLDLTKVKGE